MVWSEIRVSLLLFKWRIFTVIKIDQHIFVKLINFIKSVSLGLPSFGIDKWVSLFTNAF